VCKLPFANCTSGWMLLPCPRRFCCSRVTSDFVVDLCVGLLSQLMKHRLTRRVGTSPVKLTNHFPEVSPPATLTLEQRLTASAAARRALRLLAMLHQVAEVGTSSRPNRESSPSPVSWLLRHQGVALALVLCDTSIFGLAVLAIATVEQAITEAIAKTANISKPNFQQSQSTSYLPSIIKVRETGSRQVRTRRGRF